MRNLQSRNHYSNVNQRNKSVFHKTDLLLKWNKQLKNCMLYLNLYLYLNG